MTTGLAIFETTINESNAWLKTIEARLAGSSRHEAYAAFRAVTHALRDRLAPGGAMRLAAQLPMLLRGAFVEGWQPDETPVRTHSAQAFLEKVARGLPPDFPFEPAPVTRAVVEALRSSMHGGAIEKIKVELPAEIAALWPDRAFAR
jgi:uncharacterized protein (DUF2267 family)